LYKIRHERDAYETKRAYYFYKRTETAPSPAKSGAKFIVPRLIAQQNDLTFTDADDVFENFNWNIADFMKPADAVKGFTVKKQGSSFEIDLNGETLQFRTNNQPALPLETVIENWTAANLVLWLDTKLNQEDIPQGEMLDWLGKCIGELTKPVSLTDLYLTRFILADDLRNKISGARENAGGKAFHLTFLDKQSRTMLDWNNGFTFKDGIYDGEAFQPPGKYAYEKHFLGQHKIPAFDSDEEQLCAQVIDQLDSVKYWLRNAANHDNSFSLPVKSGRFYPDFIAELNDGRVLAVEYKGHHLKDTDDTKSKKLIGELWQKQSEGKCVFVLAVGKERKTTVNDIREQIVL
jgi:type III restriction enzyme